jgi:16S rRNA (cytosine1402-N4)-methyltransferase
MPETSRAAPPATFEQAGRKLRPTAAEMARNPRARSATLRWGVRTAAPPRTVGASMQGVAAC